VRRALPFLLLPAAVVLTRLEILTRSVLDWDESLYFLMAQAWRAGHLPYTTVWDNKPLGIYAIFAVFQALIPGVAAIRVAAMVCVAALAVTLFALTERLTQDRKAAWIAGIAAVVLSLANDGLSSNTELFMALFTALGVYAVVAEAPAWAVGLALGCAFMVKYVCAPEALVILGLLARQRGPRALPPALLAAAVPLLAAMALYAAQGQLPLWYECSVASNFRRAGTVVNAGAVTWGIQAQLWRWGPLYAAGLLLPLRGRWFPTLWLGAALLGAVGAKSFYDHYFLETLPPLCLALGVWTTALPRARLAFAAAVLALPLWAGAQALQAATGPDQTAAAGALLAATRPASLYVFDSQPILYAYADITPPTRYVLPSVLVGQTLPLVAGVDAPAEVARILATNPQIIVRRDPEPTSGNIDPAVYALADAALAAHYTLWKRFPGIALYRLRV
jgi:hypothetical protein